MTPTDIKVRSRTPCRTKRTPTIFPLSFEKKYARLEKKLFVCTCNCYNGTSTSFLLCVPKSFAVARSITIYNQIFDPICDSWRISGSSKRRKTHKLEPIASTSKSGPPKKVSNPKKDRQQFRNALVDIITWVVLLNFWFVLLIMR